MKVKDQVVSKREELFQVHEDLCEKALNLMRRKNHDYASESDPLKNFRRHGKLGIAVRLGDKLSRVEEYLKKGAFAVEDEGFSDTLIDIINYTVIMYFADMQGVE